MELNNENVNKNVSGDSSGGQNSKSLDINLSGDETNVRNDDVENSITLNGGVMNHEHIVPNVSYINTVKFNSADDVRQTMKDVLAKSTPQSYDQDIISVGESTKIHDDREPKSSKCEESSHKQVVGGQHDSGAPKRKRPGRPPKAGSSKRVKKVNVTDFYTGKLYNVVAFKRSKESDSGSDSGSGVFY